MKFTKEEIETLKMLAKERIAMTKIFKDMSCLPYRNRFETWEDAYTNLRSLGFGPEEIIKRIGKKK